MTKLDQSSLAEEAGYECGFIFIVPLPLVALFCHTAHICLIQ